MERANLTSEHRNIVIDAMRFFLFCAVVNLHMVSTSEVTHLQISSVIDAMMRFVVPCYFIISGYFLPSKIENIPQYFAKSFKRLFLPFFFWELAYYSLNFFIHFADIDPINGQFGVIKLLLRTIYDGGVGFHLWFLPWLWVCSFFFVMGRNWFGLRGVLLLGGGLYVVGLLLGPYNALIPHMQSLVAHVSSHPETYTARNGPFFGVLFICLGALIARTNETPSYLTLFVGVVVGFICELFEIREICSDAVQHRGANIDFLLGTVLYSTSVFLIFRRLSLSRRSSWMLEKCSELGRVSLGMYCVHGIFIVLVNKYLKSHLPYDTLVSLVLRQGLTVLIILASALISYYGCRIKGLKRALL